MVQGGRRVWSSCGTSGNVVSIPRRVIHVNFGAFVTESWQVASGRVWYVLLDCGSKAGWAPYIMDKRFPGRSRTQALRQISYRCTYRCT